MQVWGLGTAHTLHLDTSLLYLANTGLACWPVGYRKLQGSHPGKDSEAMESVRVATECED